jgi:Holliday junction resolvase
VIKVAIGSFGSDFIVVKEGKLVKCVEVKECHGKKYYAMPKEKEQFARIKDFCDEHSIECELWIKYPNRGWSIENIKTYI